MTKQPTLSNKEICELVPAVLGFIRGKGVSPLQALFVIVAAREVVDDALQRQGFGAEAAAITRKVSKDLGKFLETYAKENE